MRPGREEGVRKHGGSRRGTKVKPRQSYRLAPGPEVLSTSLAQAAEGAGAKVTAERDEGTRERTKGAPGGSEHRMEGGMDQSRVEGGPFGRGGRPGAQASSAPFGTRAKGGGRAPHDGGGGRTTGTDVGRAESLRPPARQRRKAVAEKAQDVERSREGGRH